MTTKIRAAAQALHDIVMKQCGGYLNGPGFEAAEMARDMRAALAEPAQPAPAADAVPVVAWMTPEESAFSHQEGAHGRGTACTVALIRQSDHLAAMEAMRQENERLRRALETVRQYPDFDAGGPLPAMIDAALSGAPETPAEELMTHLDASLKADRSAQVADVMRLVDEHSQATQMHYVTERVMLREAIEASARKLAGEA